MASIEKQIVLEVSTDNIEKINVELEGEWHRKHSRIWGWSGKKVDRYLFRIKDEYEWFECDKEMGERILEEINKVNTSNANIIKIVINRPDEVLPEQEKRFLSIWEKFKNLFKK